MLDRFVVSLLSFYLGFALFFGLIVAPAVFGTVGAKEGGEIVGKIFPYYFAASTTLLGLASILSLKARWKRVSLVILIATLISAFQEFYILPLAERLKFHPTGSFAFWHKLSVLLNLTDIVLIAVVLGWIIFGEKRGNEKG